MNDQLYDYQLGLILAYTKAFQFLQYART